MRAMTALGTASELWKPYEPTQAAPWNLCRAVHLHRRAAFGATWTELQRDLSGTPQEAVTRLLVGEARIDGVPSDYEATAQMLTDAAASSQLDRRLKAAWAYRMLFSPDPLTERLSLLWHDHFATSNLKVENLKYMRGQNDALRKNARSKFADLLTAAVHSPATLVWLDADKNTAQQPNENLGRELMELFTLGIGNYTETDVKQAARALTGWRVANDDFRFQTERHDPGEKTILGETQAFDGDKLLTLLLQHPATSKRLAQKICRMLLADTLADEVAIDALAAQLRATELDLGQAVETVLRSQRFFADENIAAVINTPPQYAIAAVRMLECFSPPPSTLLLADWMARMGQDLYYPPNVGGWPQGKAWLTSSTLIARANFATALVSGRLTQNAAPPDFAKLLERHGAGTELRQQIVWLGELMYGGLPASTIDRVTSAAREQRGPLPSDLAATVVVLLSIPEAHLA
jgi:uncharacterized protein (DUF1800 family)